ncbi:MAG: hypothetical protein LBT95_05270 [Treponema sp.]|nr:hypothetical protein [Treponema sp.]
MFSIKISALSAAAAFLLSFLVGVVSGAALLIVLIRALFFALAFFLLAGGIYILSDKFLPELFLREQAEQGREETSGSQVDISLEDSVNKDNAEIFGGPEKLSPPGEGGDAGDVPENVAGLDQNREDGYTDKKEGETDFGDFAGGSAGEGFPGEPAALPTVSGTVDMLPELDSMAEAFVPSDDAAEESNDYSSPEKSLPRGKKPFMGGDFNPKDLASALQTIIKRG